MRPKEFVADDELDTPLRGLPGDSKYELIKIWKSEFIKMNEHSDNLKEASKRTRYLNNRSQNSTFMVRKKP